jgi:chorismate lyase / 3-hydroxybenzoate synthase
MMQTQFNLSIHNGVLPQTSDSSDSIIATFVCSPATQRAQPVSAVQQTIYSSSLGLNVQPVVETWFSNTPCTRFTEPSMACALNGDLLMGVFECSEGDLSLRQVSQTAYEQIFSAIEKHGYPYVWRIWNYLPDINGNTDAVMDAERYKQFNFGRQAGFKTAHRSATVQSPAACALGIPKQYPAPVSIAFLASKTPMIALENPEQISAFHYPDQFGQQRPTFSRAGLGRLPSQELFLLSGTASIIGYETAHVGNVVLQTEQTLHNIRIMLEQANQHTVTQRAYRLEDLTARVYIRHAADFSAVARVIERCAPFKHIDFIHADICRADLDVEIEAWALENISIL